MPCVNILGDFRHTGPSFVSAPEHSTSNPLYMYLQDENKTASLIVGHA